MSDMSRQPLFKSTQLYGWESEPKEERPTGFEHSSVASTPWSTEWDAMPSRDARSGRARARRSPWNALLLAGSTTVAVCAAAVFALMQWLHV